MKLFEIMKDDLLRSISEKEFYSSRYTRIFLKDEDIDIKPLEVRRASGDENFLIVRDDGIFTNLEFEYGDEGYNRDYIGIDSFDKFDIIALAMPKIKIRGENFKIIYDLKENYFYFLNLDIYVRGCISEEIYGRANYLVKFIRVFAEGDVNYSFLSLFEGNMWRRSVMICEKNSVLNFGGFVSGDKIHIVKNDVRIMRNSVFHSNWSFLGRGRNHFDISEVTHHIEERSEGIISLKGVILERARCVFYGNADIRRSAPHSNSFVEGHFIILSPLGRADVMPSMEISQSLVRAKHSASTTKIGEDEIFYLMTRGIDEYTAVKIITQGFLETSISRIMDDEIRKKAENIIEKI